MHMSYNRKTPLKKGVRYLDMVISFVAKLRSSFLKIIFSYSSLSPIAQSIEKIFRENNKDITCR